MARKVAIGIKDQPTKRPFPFVKIQTHVINIATKNARVAFGNLASKIPDQISANGSMKKGV